MFKFYVNRAIEILLYVFMMWVKRTITYFFFYDKTKSSFLRFKEKRSMKLYVIKLLLVEVQIWFITHWRELWEMWNDHIFPTRFYWHCWEDWKWLFFIFSVIWAPTLVSVFYWIFMYQMFPYIYIFNITMITLPETVVGLYWDEFYLYMKYGIHERFLIDRTTNYVKWIKWYLYYLTNNWILKHYIPYAATSSIERALTDWCEIDRDTFELGQPIFYLYTIFFYKYVHMDYTKPKLFLYDRNTKLLTKYKYDRDYWLNCSIRPYEERPHFLIKGQEISDEAQQLYDKIANDVLI